MEKARAQARAFLLPYQKYVSQHLTRYKFPSINITPNVTQK